MIRSTTMGVLALLLALGGANASEAKKPTGQAEGLPGVESIADEAEEVSHFGGSEQTGESRTEAEMIEAENTDGCDGVFADSNMPCGNDGVPPLP
ncbi:MAG: hypothetical protein AcusKO_27340 [Acuticoccus sp.]